MVLNCLPFVNVVRNNNGRIDNSPAGAFEMTFGQSKCVNLSNFITHNVIWANQKTESFVYCWQRACNV